MAELRWENVYNTTGDAASNAAQEFRNETSRILHIRRIAVSLSVGDMAPNEIGENELSKAPVLQMDTDESPFFTFSVRVAGPPAGATPADGEMTHNEERLYGRGHLTLEPNESLFYNQLQSADPTTNVNWVIGYEF